MSRVPGGLGRLPALDERDEAFPLRAALPRGGVTPRTFRYWWNRGWHGDQGQTPQCVGYAWLHYLEDGPVTQHPRTPGHGPVISPTLVYREAQEVDEWPGTAYDGTSVRGGARVLRARGMIGEYRWGRNLDDLVDAILTHGPAVVGTWWTTGMDTPDEEGFIHYTGGSRGGHAYLVNGVNTRAARFRMKNSWGRTRWGRDGHAWIPFEDMERLIRDDGEVCIATGIAA